MGKTVMAFGETLWDLLPTASVLGGAPFNFAYRVNSLGDCAIIVTRLGRDDLGQKAWDQARALGMDTAHVQWDDSLPTGTVQISFDQSGEPDYYIVPDVAYDNIRPSEELLATAAEADCVCFGTLSQRAPTARETLRQVLDASGDSVKLLDINLRKDCYCAETVRDSLERADILRLNDGEVGTLNGLLGVARSDIAGFADEMMRRWKLSHCVVTLGERGSFMASQDGERVYAPGYKVAVVDPCGSGDAFTAGCISRLLRGRPVGECLALGNALGAMVASQQGATVPIRADDVRAFMDARHDRIHEPCLKPFLVA